MSYRDILMRNVVKLPLPLPPPLILDYNDCGSDYSLDSELNNYEYKKMCSFGNIKSLKEIPFELFTKEIILECVESMTFKRFEIQCWNSEGVSNKIYKHHADRIAGICKCIKYFAELYKRLVPSLEYIQFFSQYVDKY